MGKHKHFGTVTVGEKRTTTGGNEVVDARCEDGSKRVLLIAEQFWTGL